MKLLIWPSDLDVSILDDKLETIWIAQSLQDGFWYVAVTRVTISENFASHAAVQEFVDVKPD